MGRTHCHFVSLVPGDAMQITTETIAYLEKLAYLKLDDAQRDQLSGDLNKILNFAEQVASLDLGDITPMTHAGAQENVLRPDQVVAGLPRESALANAPQSDGTFYVVPKVLE